MKRALLQFKARRGWSRAWENLSDASRGPIEAKVVTIQSYARRFLGTFSFYFLLSYIHSFSDYLKIHK